MTSRLPRVSPLPALVLVSVLALGCHKQAAPPTPAALGVARLSAAQARAAKLEVEPAVDREVGAGVRATGRVALRDLETAHVFSPVTGRVVRIEAALGAYVKARAPLAVIASADVGQVFADVEKANADFAADDANLKRQRELFQAQATSRKDLEAAQAAAAKSRAELERACHKARLLRASARDGRAQEYVLRAPIDGEVLARNVSPGVEVQGEYAGGAIVELFTIGNLDPILVEADVIPTPDGAQVPLSELAHITEEDGPVVIFREDHQRYTPVKFSVRGRDLSSTISEGQRRIAAAVKLPYDTRLEWAGEINQLRETTQRLMVIIPLTLLIIGFLVYVSVKSVRDTVIVLLGVPVAASGGILALAITGSPLSISAAMGFISILGIAVQDALIVVSYAQRLWRAGHSLEVGARLAAERGLRPVLMTAVVAMLGLLPAALSSGIGSETQKPLAIVVIGGALSMAILPRVLHPPLLVLSRIRWRRIARGPLSGPGAT